MKTASVAMHFRDELGADDDMDDGMGGLSGGIGNSMEPGKELVPTPVESRTDFMVSVEFYGVVKIYNPVRENFLRLAAGQDVVDETADLTEEVAEPGVIAPAPEAPAPEAPAPNETLPAENPPTDVPAQPPTDAPTEPPVQPPTGETAPAATPPTATPPAATP